MLPRTNPPTPAPQPDETPTVGEMADEIATLAVGGAILTIALFPFAVPMIALTLIVLVPLLLVGLAAGLVFAVLAAPVFLVRRLSRPRPVAPTQERERPRLHVAASPRLDRAGRHPC